jgi:tight adherence protein B
MPLIIGLIVFAVAALWLERRNRSTDPARRIAQLVERRTPAARVEVTEGGLIRRTLAWSEGRLVRLPGWAGFGSRLERAGITRPPVEVAWLLAGLVLAWALVGELVGDVLLALFFAVLAVLGTRLWLGFRGIRRRRAFDEQLPDVLAEIASALRAGHGFLQAVQAVSADAPPPIGTELQRALAEARLGRAMDEALLAAGDRVRSADFDFVLDAVIVQRQVGGSLAGIFEIVGDSVRQRQQFALKLRALTAMGRMSAGVLLALPILIALGLALMDSAYMAPLVDTSAGRMILGGGVLMLCIGFGWLQRIVGAVEG